MVQMGVTVSLGLSGKVIGVCLRSERSMAGRGDLRHSMSDSVMGACDHAEKLASQSNMPAQGQNLRMSATQQCAWHQLPLPISAATVMVAPAAAVQAVARLAIVMA